MRRCMQGRRGRKEEGRWVTFFTNNYTQEAAREQVTCTQQHSGRVVCWAQPALRLFSLLSR